MQPHIRWSAAFALLTFVHIQAEEIITQWNFNDGDPASPPPAVGAGTALPLGGVSVNSASGTGSSDSATANTAWSLAAFPKQGLTPLTAGAGFTVSTTGYEQVRLQFDLRPSGTASRRTVVLYSTDGVSFSEAAAFTLAASGAFTNHLSVDFSSVPATADSPNLTLRLVSGFSDASQYQGVTSAYSSAGTWRFDMVTVLGSPIGGVSLGPKVVTAPADLSVLAGTTAVFHVVATGSPPLRYQWRFGTEDLTGKTNATLELLAVRPEQAGEYRVFVSNDAGNVLSEPARLSVTEPPPPPVIVHTNIAHLRSLVDPVTWLPVDTTTLFAVRGLVTTRVNLAASPDQLFFLQDDTAGIAVVVGDASSAMPAAGAEIEVTGLLGQSAGLLELQLAGTNLNHAVHVISAGHPLPAALPVTATITNDPAGAESIEGRYVVIRDVTLDTAKPAFGNTSATYQLRDASGAEFPMRVDSRTDINGQPKPVGAFTVMGVLSQSHADDATPPFDGWFVLPTRYADLVPQSQPPRISFEVTLQNLVRPGDALTNSFTEQCLRVGETMTFRFAVTDPDGDPLSFDRERLESAAPPGSTFSFELTDANLPDSSLGKEVHGSLSFTPAAANTGQLYVLPLEAHDALAVSKASLSIYVPDAGESYVALTEFLANPTSDPTAPQFNPLSRANPSGNPSSDDEFIELVNLGPGSVDLQGWTLSDAQRVRHEFGTGPLTLGASGALVLFGGPPTENPPVLPVPVSPASSGGLSLNNTGDAILLRNAASNLVARVVYVGGDLSADGSLQRVTNDGEFRGPPGPEAARSTPGRRLDGSAWIVSDPPPLGAPIVVTAGAVAGGIRLAFNVEAGHSYSVHRSTAPEGPFAPIAEALETGTYDDSPPEGPGWFYRVGSP